MWNYPSLPEKFVKFREDVQLPSEEQDHPWSGLRAVYGELNIAQAVIENGTGANRHSSPQEPVSTKIWSYSCQIIWISNEAERSASLS
jgi:hypothetical protein